MISLRMGPKFMTDEITVETSDHARLKLKLSCVLLLLMALIIIM